MYKKFITFIFAALGRRKINHSGGWCGCALGEFAIETGLDHGDNALVDLAHDIAKDAPALMYMLNYGHTATAIAPTYGDLQKFILDNEPASDAATSYWIR